MTLSGGGNPGDPSQHNGGGLMDPNASMDDIPDLSIAVTEIGVIPPPPMFSSPSPPLPPPPPLTSNQVTNGHVIVNHQVFHTNITVDGQNHHGHDQVGGHAQPDSPPRFIMPGKYLFFGLFLRNLVFLAVFAILATFFGHLRPFLATLGKGYQIVNHQVFHTNITVDGQNHQIDHHQSSGHAQLSQTLPLGLS